MEGVWAGRRRSGVGGAYTRQVGEARMGLEAPEGGRALSVLVHVRAVGPRDLAGRRRALAL